MIVSSIPLSLQHCSSTHICSLTPKVHPGVNFEHVSVHDLPFLVYDESHNPPLFWSERGAPVMEVSTDIAFSLLQESNSDFHY